MSLNQSHAAYGQGVVLFYGERLLIFYDGCDLRLTSDTSPQLKGSYCGRAYLTSHRVIFTSKDASSKVVSFSMPFIQMKGVDIKQPVFGANRIEGRVTAEPTGGWLGEAEFSLTFKKGGAIEFGQALIELGKRASRANRDFKPPPYAPTAVQNGAVQYYSCPPPAYIPPYQDPYYGFVPQHESFAPPPPQSLYHVGAPPPYPGACPPMATGWSSGPVGAQIQPPYQYQAAYAPPNVQNNDAQFQSAAHAAKAAEAANTSAVAGGYYFPGNPHTVYAQPTAPPGTEAPPYPGPNNPSNSRSAPSAPTDDSAPPPPYEEHITPTAKKNQ